MVGATTAPVRSSDSGPSESFDKRDGKRSGEETRLARRSGSLGPARSEISLILRGTFNTARRRDTTIMCLTETESVISCARQAVGHGAIRHDAIEADPSKNWTSLAPAGGRDRPETDQLEAPLPEPEQHGRNNHFDLRAGQPRNSTAQVATSKASWRVAKLSMRTILPSSNDRTNVRGPPAGSSTEPAGSGWKSGPSTVMTTWLPASSASMWVTVGNRPPRAEPSTSRTASSPVADKFGQQALPHHVLGHRVYQGRHGLAVRHLPPDREHPCQVVPGLADVNLLSSSARVLALRRP